MVFVTDVPSCKNNQPLEGFHSIKNNNKLPMFAPEIGSIHSSSFRLKIVVPIIIGMALRTGRTDRNYENQVDFFLLKSFFYLMMKPLIQQSMWMSTNSEQ